MQGVFSLIKLIYHNFLPKLDLTPINAINYGFNHFEEYGKAFKWTKSDSEIKLLIPVYTDAVLNKPELNKLQIGLFSL